MNLARRIRDCRYAKGWGPDELAGRASISRTALYQIESGKTETPRAGTLRRIATALGVSTEALLGHEAISYENLHAVASQESEPSVSEAGEAQASNATLGIHLDGIEALGHDRISAMHAKTARSRRLEIDRKFHELLESPLGESLVQIVEETHRLLPVHRSSAQGLMTSEA